MDLVGYDQARFEEIVADYRAFAEQIGIDQFAAFPVSGLRGDNITALSDATPWYRGPALLDHLESISLDQDALRSAPFRMAVQWVNRPNHEFRGFSGLIASDSIRPRDAVTLLPSGRTSTISRIVTMDGDLDAAVAGKSINLTLADELDCSRGDLIAAADAPPEIADPFEATIVWMGEEPLLPGRPSWLKIGATPVTAQANIGKASGRGKV